MTPEQRVRAAMTEERTVVERSLRHLTEWLGERQAAFGVAKDDLTRRPKDDDVVDLADAALGLQATAARAEFFQDHLRRLGSSDEYERRMKRAASANADAHGVDRTRRDRPR
jgi:hypothetical protein